MIQAFILSLQTGRGTKLEFADPLWYNYQRLLGDEIFKQTLGTTFIYLIIQVPIMIVLALVLANLLNNPRLKAKAFWRTAIFLPCAVGLVSYSLVFRTMFANDGFVNDLLTGIGILDEPVNWLGETDTARFVLILGLLWRWTGYNMLFFLAGLQNIDRSTIEAARMDGASSFQTFWHVTVPQLRPMILLIAIISTNGTLQLFDESWSLTQGGPAYTTMSMSHYLYELSFQQEPELRLRRGGGVRDPHPRRRARLHPAQESVTSVIRRLRGLPGYLLPRRLGDLLPLPALLHGSSRRRTRARTCSPRSCCPAASSSPTSRKLVRRCRTSARRWATPSRSRSARRCWRSSSAPSPATASRSTTRGARTC